MSMIYNSFFNLELSGTSHSDEIVLKVKNFPKNIKVDYQKIEHNLALRRSSYSFNTLRKEKDEFYFKSGVKDNLTTGEELIICLKNNNFNSKSYIKGNLRANHADYPAILKYGEDFDLSGGSFFSGRMTTVFVIFGTLCLDILNKNNIKIGTHIKEVLDIKDDEFSIFNESYFDTTFNMFNKEKKEKLINKLNEIKDDTVGGMLESIVINYPACIGSPFFNPLESSISSFLYLIPSLKGVLFGDGFDFIHKFGSEVIDELSYVNDEIKINGNHMGGINGGISNGNPLIIKTIFKPISSIYKPYNSVNFLEHKNIVLENKGRHDKFMLNRCCIIVTLFLAITLLDSLLKEDKLCLD